MIGERDDRPHLPAAVEVELTVYLAAWADGQRLSDTEASAIRARVLALASVTTVLEPVPGAERAAGFDSEWLWSLLRPVTALMDRTADGPYRPYLRLA
jgi:hypothetical protein